jgi:hypothetical protein
LAAVGEPEPDFLTDTAVFIALALEVVPERDLRVEEDHQANFFFEVFSGQSYMQHPINREHIKLRACRRGNKYEVQGFRI